jgi:hypothetical protein
MFDLGVVDENAAECAAIFRRTCEAGAAACRGKLGVNVIQGGVEEGRKVRLGRICCRDQQ